MSRMKRFLEQVMEELGADQITEEVLQFAQRRLEIGPTQEIPMNEQLDYKGFAVVMCDRCVSMIPVHGPRDRGKGLPATIGIPTKCSCGGTYKRVEPDAKGVVEGLGFAIKREGELEIGDIVEPFGWGMGGGWTRQLVINVEPVKRKIKFCRPMATGTYVGLPSSYLTAEVYEGYYSEKPEDQSLFKVFPKDCATESNYLADRRTWAEKAQLDLYWQRLHGAIERECPEPAENIHQLRYDCFELEHRCQQLKVSIPDMPTKEEAERGV